MGSYAGCIGSVDSCVGCMGSLGSCVGCMGSVCSWVTLVRFWVESHKSIIFECVKKKRKKETKIKTFSRNFNAGQIIGVGDNMLVRYKNMM